MPGSKRRALKKLLSPSSTPTSGPTPSSTSGSLAPVDSAQSGASASSVASDSRNCMTDAEIAQQAELEKMDLRKGSIGSGDLDPLSGSQAGGVGGVPPLQVDGTDGQGLPPPAVEAPPLEGQGELLSVPSLPDSGSGGGKASMTSPSPAASLGASPSHSPLGAAAKGMYGKIFKNGSRESLGSPGSDGVSGNGHAAAGAGSGGAGGGGGKKSSKQKFAERQARKQQALLEQAPPSDPHWDKQLEKERIDEVRVVSDACAGLGRTIHEITPDGHCMYHAIADQLACIGRIPAEQADDPRSIRAAAAAYMAANPDEFRFFLPSVNGEDTAAATEHDGVMTEKEYAQYCHNVEHTGEWGGEPEIQALSRAFKIPIHVIQRGPPTIVSHGGADDAVGGATTIEQSAAMGDEVVRISYHRRMYGLGEHYNSLRKVAA